MSSIKNKEYEEKEELNDKTDRLLIVKRKVSNKHSLALNIWNV